jgi:hypothetical protein
MVQLANLLEFKFEDIVQRVNQKRKDYLKIKIDSTFNVAPDLFQHQLFDRHTNRFPFQPDPIPSEILNALKTEHEGTAELKILTEDKHRDSVAALVRAASLARFQNRQIHEWFMATLRFSPEQVASGTGLDVNTLNLPPGGKWFLKTIRNWRVMACLGKIGAYRLFSEIESKPIQAGPAIIVIKGQNTADGAIESGRLMERVWIYLNSQGIAIQPYFVVTDQIERNANPNKIPNNLRPQLDNLQKASKKFFGTTPDTTVYMLLRAGIPTVSPTWSKRLPVEAVCV